MIPGAVEAVERLAARWPLGLASSSNREPIDLALESSGLGRLFRDRLVRGGPAREARAGRYLEAARRLGAEPGRCAAIEDSENGILSAKAAGMRVLAIPNLQFPPPQRRSPRPTPSSPRSWS